MNRIEVTCAIVVSSDLIIACQRKANSDHPLQWEFPGGKIEKMETAEDCIVREIKEELDVKFHILKKLDAVDFDYISKSIRLIPFIGTIGQDLPKSLEHEQFGWFACEELNKINLSGADMLLFQLNKDIIACFLT
jgi:8-oxo-dGTP diphosphatase